MRVGRGLMGAMYLVAGAGHFVATRMYERAMPDYLPAHRALVLLSGAAEMAGGLGVLVGPTRRAAWGLVVLLVGVMPANVWMVEHPEMWPGIPVWALWLRLPLQAPLIWWAWRYTRRVAG
jgi:uncharacterized membrane protein